MKGGKEEGGGRRRMKEGERWTTEESIPKGK
jgi:hypothetical protein